MIETDKVSMEIQAIAGGVLSEIRVPAGDIAPVGTVVAVISAGHLTLADDVEPALVPEAARAVLEAARGSGASASSPGLRLSLDLDLSRLAQDALGSPRQRRAPRPAHRRLSSPR